MRLSGPRNSPLCPQALPEHCLRLRKIEGFCFFFPPKELLKQTHACTIYRAYSLAKTPSGVPHPGLKKEKKQINPNGNDSTNKRCFSCGQMELFCWQCPAKQGQPAVPIQTNTNSPKALCPRCQKGYHWVKDCRSKFHKDGTKLTPQVQESNFSQFQGNGQQGQPQPQTTIGADG